MSTEQQQKEEIKKILKEIYSKYRRFASFTLYSKMTDGELNYVAMSDTPIIIDNILNRRLEYALYIVYLLEINPSQTCRVANYSDAVDQFVGYIATPYNILQMLVRYFREHKDPLTQVLSYWRFLSATGQLQHVYICPYVYYVVPYGKDPTSIFHGREGIVAYCSNFIDLVHIGTDGITNFMNQQTRIKLRAVDKLKENEELRKLRKKDPIEACDINLIKDIIHDEIEKANELMRQYGIVRVAFPLE